MRHRAPRDLISILLLQIITAHAPAAEPSVGLLRSDSLAGWEHGAPPRGWHIAEGVLRGAAGSTPLLSGWTMGDFALSFRWAVAKHGALVVELPDVPAGPGLAVSLAAGESGLTITDKGQQVLSGKVDPAAKTWHTARLTRLEKNFRSRSTAMRWVR